MAFGQNQAIRTRIARPLRSPVHSVIHQRSGKMRQRERGSGMAAACRRSYEVTRRMLAPPTDEESTPGQVVTAETVRLGQVTQSKSE